MLLLLLASVSSQPEVVLFIWPRFGQNSGIDLELIKMPVWLLSSKGDFIDLPKSFSIIASVKCRNSSFRWIGIRGKNTAWTIYRSLNLKKKKKARPTIPTHCSLDSIRYRHIGKCWSIKRETWSPQSKHPRNKLNFFKKHNFKLCILIQL